jgi:hypothetical protein
VRLTFRLLDARGWIDVVVEPNTDPDALGCPPSARDLPVCTATVAYQGTGYRAALGWVQLVRSTDGASRGEAFEMDPYEPLGRQSHPFCFFGFAPALFDAPARTSRDELEWIANSFLAFVAPDAANREARAIAGFAWGFSIRAGEVVLRPPEELASAAWDGHLPLLRREHPDWAFASGYRSR